MYLSFNEIPYKGILGEVGHLSPLNWSVGFQEKPTHILNPVPLVFWRIRCIHSENTTHLPITAVSHLCSENICASGTQCQLSPTLKQNSSDNKFCCWTKYLEKCNARTVLCIFHFYNNFNFFENYFLSEFLVCKIPIIELH